jgi:large subunit ribosomal protein L25
LAGHALSADARGGIGKGIARKLRAAGRIPAIIYGKGKQSEAISVDPARLERLLHTSDSGMNTLIDLSVDGRTSTVLLKDLQRDPIRGRYLHADFFVVDLEQELQVAVPLHFIGKAAGLEFGGIVEHPLREIEVACLPQAIPDSIEVDVTALNIGDSLHVRDLQTPAGVRVISDGDLAIALVEQPAVAEEPSAEEAVTAEGAEAPVPEAAKEAGSE